MMTTNLSRGVACVAVAGMVMLCMGARPNARAQRAVADPSATPLPAQVIRGVRTTSDEGYHNQPAVTSTDDQTLWIAWVRYTEDVGDEVMVRSQLVTRQQQRMTRPVTLTPKHGQYIRPVIAAAGSEVWCLWTETRENDRAAIWFSRHVDGKWSPAARLLPNERRAHQNPEVAGTSDGRVAVVYQLNDGIAYRIHLRMWDKGAWQTPRQLSDDQSDAWDPVTAFDTAGKLHVAWSGFHDGDYDVYWMRIDGETSTSPRRVSARGEYDLHPWLAASPDGRMWINWDIVQISAHGHSGTTTITGANLRGRQLDEADERGGAWSGIEVRVIDGDEVRIPGHPREEIIAPEGYQIAHRGMAKIAVSDNGEPWVVYRVLLRTITEWSPLPRDGYMWDLMARPFRDGKWQDAVLFSESDGYLEEPGVVSTLQGIKVAYTSEHRHTHVRDVRYHEKKPSAGPISEAPRETDHDYDHHHDFDGFLGWHGDVYTATLPMWVGADPDIAAMPIEREPADKEVQRRLTREMGKHEVATGGKTYRLFWGDTHRHSNISRCSIGSEPNPEDLYRYGIDIHMYDFLALSDHSEYTTDYYWWRQQKLADLYHIPHFLSVLYNSEWSMRFPYGHTNTIFPSRHNVKMHGWLGDTKTHTGGWEMLERGGYKAITIPHTPADPGMGTTWSEYNEKYLRLCEIFQSRRGSYEHDGCPRQHNNATNKQGFYWNALEKGYRVGVICSSDHGYGAAYACVYATENTREAIWQAMWDRRTYGSTTYGLVVEMRSGERWMGENWTSTSAPPLQIYVRGSAPLRSVEIIGRSQVLHAEGSLEKPLDVREHRINWVDSQWDQVSGEQWYYVRVIQQDDEMAWTSPVWVAKP